MRRFVNGEETELDPSGAQVSHLVDRLQVRSANGTHSAVAVRQGDSVLVSYRGRQYRVERSLPRTSRSGASGTGEIRAPMPGLIVDVRVKVNDVVQKGTTLLVLEAMKTQQPFIVPFDGTVTQLPVSVGDQVSDGNLLIFIQQNAKITDRDE